MNAIGSGNELLPPPLPPLLPPWKLDRVGLLGLARERAAFGSRALALVKGLAQDGQNTRVEPNTAPPLES